MTERLKKIFDLIDQIKNLSKNLSVSEYEELYIHLTSLIEEPDDYEMNHHTSFHNDENIIIDPEINEIIMKAYRKHKS